RRNPSRQGLEAKIRVFASLLRPMMVNIVAQSSIGNPLARRSALPRSTKHSSARERKLSAAMNDLYQQDLAYIHARGFGDFARSAAPGIVRLLREAEIPVNRVIEVGCGAGPLTAALLDAGFDVTGIDVSAELLRIAQASCPGARFLVGSIYAQEIP